MLVLFAVIDTGYGYQSYQKEIPNGDAVPHPCRPNALWEGVGHLKETGGGNRNPFGKDFKSHNSVSIQKCN